MLKTISIFMALLVLALNSPEASAAGKGMVKIVTTPGDAKIFINGKRKGNSPAKPGQTFAIKLPEGEYVVEVVKEIDRFREYRGKKAVFVSEDSLQTIDFELNRQFTKLGEKKDRAEKAEAVRKAAAKKRAIAARIAPVLKKLEANMVKIPGGTFRMGCVWGGGCYPKDSKPVHRVTVSSFYMSKYEVTFDQWDACFADRGCGYKPGDNGWGRGDRPVIKVSWDDAQQFIKWLNKKTGQSWRLPTEAEWEYAARAGSATKYSWGNSVGKNKANCYGTYCGDSWENTSPVGSFSANKFGLYDMHGNIHEWCSDWYGKYSSSAQTDPKGPNSGSNRVLRGDSWANSSTNMRSAQRDSLSPSYRASHLGFRLLRQP